MKKIWTFILLIVIILVLCSGCSKNTVISLYDNVTKTIGDLCLTNDILLQGKRKFGILLVEKYCLVVQLLKEKMEVR